MEYKNEEGRKLEEFQRIIGYNFKNRKLLTASLTHKSYAHENAVQDTEDNERLEFLGDAVLGLAINTLLYQIYPDYAEGPLTKIKSHLVSATTLYKVAKEIGIGQYLLLGRGEESSGGRMHRSNLSGALEALMGAMYIDGGYEEGFRFVSAIFQQKLYEKNDEDYKSNLQEISLKRFKTIPRYEIVSQAGPDHKKIFETTVKLKGVMYGKGTGMSKKSGEQFAAKDALKKLCNPGIDPLSPGGKGEG